MSLETTIADEVVAALNAEVFSQAVTAVRDWLPVFDPDQLSNLKVTVIPKRTTIDNAARGVSKREHEIIVAVQKRLGIADGDTGDKPEIDALHSLSVEIRDFLDQQSMTSGKFLRVEHRVMVDPDYIYELRTFTSLINVAYRAFISS
ncbi:MAG: hypothetical protein ACE5KM_13785 [Planctomycetaceae bacterium]